MRAKGILIIACLMIAALFTSCTGSDGDDGNAYVAYTWSIGSIYFDTNDPAFAGDTYIYDGVYEQTRAGTYTLWYRAWNKYTWYGTYTIYINEGEDGKFLSDGDDGDDLYFEVYCPGYAPTLYVHDTNVTNFSTRSSESSASDGKQQIVDQRELQLYKDSGMEQQKSDVSSAFDADFIAKLKSEGQPQAWENTQTVTSGKYTIVFKSRRVILEE